LINDEGRKLGLVVNTAKFEVITYEENVSEKFKHTAPDIKHIQTSDARLLGAPIGGMQSVGPALVAKLHELRRLLGRLAHLRAHDTLFLLKNCFANPN
jgi:hypothetical protein